MPSPTRSALRSTSARVTPSSGWRSTPRGRRSTRWSPVACSRSTRPTPPPGTSIPTRLSVSSVYSPHGIVVTGNGATVYVVGQGGSDYGGRVLPIVASTGAAQPMTGFDQFGISDPAAVAVNPAGTELLVADSANNWVNPVAVSTFADPADPVRLPTRPRDRAPDRHRLRPGRDRRVRGGRVQRCHPLPAHLPDLRDADRGVHRRVVDGGGRRTLTRPVAVPGAPAPVRRRARQARPSTPSPQRPTPRTSRSPVSRRRPRGARRGPAGWPPSGPRGGGSSPDSP